MEKLIPTRAHKWIGQTNHSSKATCKIKVYRQRAKKKKIVLQCENVKYGDKSQNILWETVECYTIVGTA